MKHAAVTGEVLLDSARVGAGESIRGRVSGDHPEVRLVRIESTPLGVSPVVVATAEVQEGRFDLGVDAAAAPSVAGRGCSIGYLVRAGVQRRTDSDPTAEVVIEAVAVPALVREPEPLLDRMISRFDSRHFHLELAHAELHGGGLIRGRAHWDRGEPPPMVKVSARCDEAWRADRGAINLHHPPLWRWESMWSDGREVEWPEGARWVPYTFRIPEGLPPAVEAATLAWRYEIEVSRRVRLGINERAVATPIGFNVAGA